ncbi:MAG: hypothetical protein PF505_03290 [Vallitaleaceae bacterium]|nr:hypothetical protein [Vallitaleaceae bacterium]
MDNLGFTTYLAEIEPPSLGTTINDMPFFTKAFMEILGEYLDEHTCHRGLDLPICH